MHLSNKPSRVFRAAAWLLLCTFATVCLTGCNEDKKYREHLDKGDKYFAAGDYQNALAEYEEALEHGQDSKKVTRGKILDLHKKIELTNAKLKEIWLKEANESLAQANSLMGDKKFYEARDAYNDARQSALKAGEGDLVKQIDDILSEEPFPTMKQIDDYEKTELARIEKYQDDTLEPYQELESAMDRVYSTQKSYLWYKSVGYNQDDFIVQNAKEALDKAELDLVRTVGRLDDPDLDHAYDRMRAAYSQYSLMVWLHGDDSQFTKLAYESYHLEKERFNGKISAVSAVVKNEVENEVARRKALLAEEVARRRAELHEQSDSQSIERIDEDDL